MPLEPATPQVSSTQRSAPSTKAVPQPPYKLCFNPFRWDVFGEGEDARVLPALSKAKYLRGANGVMSDRQGRPIVGAMEAQVAENGNMLIPFDVDGPGTTYLVRDPITRGWYSKWERPAPGTDRVLEGGKPYHDWMASLIERGIIEPPGLVVLEGLLGKYQDLASRCAPGTPGQNERLHKSMTAKLAAVEREIEDAMSELADELPTAPELPETGD